mgnify:CR=1 FL=1
MALNKTLVFNKYVDDIPTERERRISGIKKFDSRASFLWAYKSEGKTKYKPIIGKAKDIV